MAAHIPTTLKHLLISIFECRIIQHKDTFWGQIVVKWLFSWIDDVHRSELFALKRLPLILLEYGDRKPRSPVVARSETIAGAAQACQAEGKPLKAWTIDQDAEQKVPLYKDMYSRSSLQ